MGETVDGDDEEKDGRMQKPAAAQSTGVGNARRGSEDGRAAVMPILRETFLVNRLYYQHNLKKH